EKAYIDQAGQYFQVSDKNKKDNIQKIDNPIDRLAKINGYTYQFKLLPNEIEKGQKAVTASGVLAQEMELAMPEAVQKNDSGEYFVDYAAITPLLIEVAKAQQDEIAGLRKQNESQQKINELLLARLEKLEQANSK
ncbi:MAG TPA: tail fiber domain-containing protein, partial [Flavobacterium sp.]|nr:tail fiber domain-containing protein [Flavobacterium sp.]